MREAEEAGGEKADQQRSGWVSPSFFLPNPISSKDGETRQTSDHCVNTPSGGLCNPHPLRGGETRFQKLSKNTTFRSGRRKITRKHAAEGIFSAKVLVAVLSRPDPTLLVNNEWLKNGWVGAVTH